MKKLKGFTLIECLIAMFILGVSSLLLAQGYSQLMKMTSRNNLINTSISQQMADAETHIDDTAGTKAKMLQDKAELKVKLMSAGVTEDGEIVSGSIPTRSYDPSNSDYKTTVKVYEVKAYKPYKAGATDNQYEHSESKEGTEMRYIYFHE